MGRMRFIVFPPDRITSAMAQQAYLCGMDLAPWEARVHWEAGELIVERAVSESGCLHVPWPVEGHGVLVLSTGTLRERPEPYTLPLELARGKLAQLRNQLAEWESVGLVPAPEVREKLQAATRAFGEAVVGEQDSSRSAELAEQVLRLSLDAGRSLTAGFCEQALSIRRRMADRLPTLLGADLGASMLDDYTASQFLQTFNAAVVPIVWHDVEAREGKFCWDLCDQQLQWCRENGLTVCAGPLLQFDQRCVPDWLYLCDGDFDSLFQFASEFVGAAVQRYRGRVALWIAAGRVNTAEALSLTEEERVKLTARAVELTHALDPQADVAVWFDQPWGEYLGRQGNDFPPLHFADALLRADLGLSALGLEINLGYCPGGTLARDLLEFNQQIDYWSLLGVPLYLALTVPSSSDPDPLAQRNTVPFGDLWTPASQQSWVSRYLPLFLAKPNVRGILWNQLRDCEPHSFPHGGLFDLRRHPKPALRQIASLRQAHLK